jgi:thioredoxin 1
MKPVTDSTIFDVVERGKKPIVIKFEAKWCQPCKAMTPVLLDIEKSLGDKIDFYAANVEHAMLMSQRYKINQIPAIVAIEDGVVTGIKTGSASKADILQWLKMSISSLGPDS